jgi:universal stress protein A
MGSQKQTEGSAEKPLVCKPQKILLPIDFSNNCQRAVPYAEQFAQQFEARLYLVHIIEPPPMLVDMRDVPLALTEKEISARARAELEELARSIKTVETSEVILRKGKAHHEITTLASELGIDMIIMSTHGYTGLQHTLLGSTTERVVRYAPCPVLVVRCNAP